LQQLETPRVPDFANSIVVVRGGGDIGSGVIWRLRRVGFPVIVTELDRPLTIRRTVAFSTAVTDGSIMIEDVDGVRVATRTEALEVAATSSVPVLVSPGIPEVGATVVVDARLAKRNLDTSRDQAPFVVALGPGFSAGDDCDAIVETMRGHDLGRVIWNGPAAPNTGVPGMIGGESGRRVIHADLAGALSWDRAIGDTVEEGETLGWIDDIPVRTRITGTVRGLLGVGPVAAGLKIADVDPRFDPSAVWRISDKALSVGGGVLEAILVWFDSRTP
jgi:xanthine dehydrogenase accessory factor